MKNTGKLDMQKNLAAAHSGMPVGSHFPILKIAFSFVLAD